MIYFAVSRGTAIHWVMKQLLLTIFALTIWPAMVAAGEVCVTNGDTRDFLFVAETRGGDREIARIAPDEKLCADGPATQGGVVSVFENVNEAEGCSRLVASPGGMRVLKRYVSFDRCAWDDNTNAEE